MNFIENMVKDISGYCPSQTKRPDFDAFWEENLRISRAKPINRTVRQVDYPCKHVHMY